MELELLGIRSKITGVSGAPPHLITIKSSSHSLLDHIHNDDDQDDHADDEKGAGGDNNQFV